MEPQHFIDLSNVDSDLVQYVIESSSFSNNPTSYPTVSTYPLDLTGDFTFFITFSVEDYKTTYGSFLAQCLLTNFNNSNKSGWSFGWSSSGQLFLECNNPFYSHKFDIQIGGKNCICLRKIDNSFTLYQYDLVSREIHRKEEYIFPSDADINDGVGPTLGGTYDYFTNYQIPLFWGEAEVFVGISAAIDEPDIEIIFQGFLPYTISSIGSSSFQTIDEEWLLSSDDMIPLQTPLSGIYSYIDSYIINNFSGVNGLIGFASGVTSSGGGVSVNFQIYSSSGICDIGSLLGSGTATTSGSWPNQGNFTLKIYENWQENVFISHFFDFSGSAFQGYSNYDHLMGIVSGVGIGSTGFNSGYYQTFNMRGVFSDVEGSVFLAERSGTPPSQLNQQAFFDNIIGKFAIPSGSKTIFVDGERLLPSDWSQSGDYVLFPSITVNNLNLVTYDSFVGEPNPQMLGLNSVATGKFNQFGAIVKTGINPYTDMRRTNDFLETTYIHPYHGISVPNPQTNVSEDNEDFGWS